MTVTGGQMDRIDKQFQKDRQCVKVRFVEGFSRQRYIGALFRLIRDVERGALRDIETDNQ